MTNVDHRALYVGEGPGTYTVDREHARGAYRYLSLINNGTGEIVLTSLSVYFTAAPTQDLESSYSGYFHTNDELINRIWYAGAYTNRECSSQITLLMSGRKGSSSNSVPPPPTTELCDIDPQYGDALVNEQLSDPPTIQNWYVIRSSSSREILHAE